MRNFVYVRNRPFHPQRLWKLVYDKFILRMEDPDDGEDEEWEDDEDDEDQQMTDLQQDEALSDEEMQQAGEDSSSSRGKNSTPSSPQSAHSTVQTIPSPSKPRQEATQMNDEDETMSESDDLVPPPQDVILENKRQHPQFARLFRSKGGFFLATRPQRSGDWSQAGALLTLEGGTAWLCTLPEEEYMNGSDEVNALIKHDIEKGGEWGDRRQELVFIGENLDHEAMEVILDECLLNDTEWDQWQEIMRNGKWNEEQKRDALEEVFEDGFPDWQGDDDHDHDHEGHDHEASRKISDYVKQEA